MIEATRVALRGAFGFARFDAEAAQAFRPSPLAVAHSWTALALAIPLSALFLILSAIAADADATVGDYVQRLAALLISWLGFIGILALMLTLLGQREKVAASVLTLNWVRLADNIIMTGLAAVGATGFVPDDALQFVMFLLVLYVVPYHAFALHHAAKISLVESVAFAALELLIRVATIRIIFALF
jgi:hypothetical protein